MKPNAIKYIIAGVSVGIVILAFASVVVNLQDQLAQRDEYIRRLQEQNDELKRLVGPIKNGAWNVVATFGGASGLTTDYFYVAGTDLRMNWTCFSVNGTSAVFSFYVYKEGQTDCVEAFTNLQNQGSTIIHNVEKTNYYLGIFENQIDQWSITVETWIPS